MRVSLLKLTRGFWAARLIAAFAIRRLHIVRHENRMLRLRVRDLHDHAALIERANDQLARDNRNLRYRLIGRARHHGRNARNRRK